MVENDLRFIQIVPDPTGVTSGHVHGDDSNVSVGSLDPFSEIVQRLAASAIRHMQHRPGLQVADDRLVVLFADIYLVNANDRNARQGDGAILPRQALLLDILDGTPIQVVILGQSRYAHLVAKVQNGSLEFPSHSGFLMRQKRQPLHSVRVAIMTADSMHVNDQNPIIAAYLRRLDFTGVYRRGRDIPAATGRAVETVGFPFEVLSATPLAGPVPTNVVESTDRQAMLQDAV